MKKVLLTFIAFIFLASTGFMSAQFEESLKGEYIVAEFEYHSLLILKEENVFEYKFGLGGCQGSMKGKWIQQKDKLILVSENQNMTNNSDSLMPIYPIFDNDYWKIRKDGVQPEKQVNTGCFQTKKIHKKR